MFTLSKKAEASEQILVLTSIVLLGICFIIVFFVSSNTTGGVQETVDFKYQDEFQPLFLRAFIEFEFTYEDENYAVYDLLVSDTDEDFELLAQAKEQFFNSYNIDFRNNDNILQNYFTYAQGDSSRAVVTLDVLVIDRGVSELPNFGSLYLLDTTLGLERVRDHNTGISYFPILTDEDQFTLVYFKQTSNCKSIEDSIEVRCNYS